jgi:hypothetical protein
MDETRIARDASRPSSVVVAGVVNQPSPPSRRSFLKALAIAPLVPGPIIAASPCLVIPAKYEVDFQVFKPCDYHFDVWDQDRDGFTLEIWDFTNRRGYEGYIRWWAVRDLDDGFEGRNDAYATGLAKVRVPEDSPAGDGIATVRFAF